MRRSARSITTSLSRFLILAAIAACDPAPLEGKATCFSMKDVCASGELCRTQVTGAADDAGTDFGCVKVPGSCNVHDCSGSACPKCIVDLCAAPADNPLVQGRYLDCRF